MILDSGKTAVFPYYSILPFESVVILDSGKTGREIHAERKAFESVVILDSGKTTSTWRKCR